MQSKTIKENLICDLNDKERREYGILLATTLGDMEQVEAQKKTAADSYKDQLASIQFKADELSRKVRDGKEWRSVECRVMYSAPDKEHKQTVRLDTGETVKTERMTNMDLQLVMPLDIEDDSDESDKSDEGSREWSEELLEDTFVDLLQQPTSHHRGEMLEQLLADGTARAFVDYALSQTRAGETLKHGIKRMVLRLTGWPEAEEKWISPESVRMMRALTDAKGPKRIEAKLYELGTSLPVDTLAGMDLCLEAGIGTQLPAAVREKLRGRVDDLLYEADEPKPEAKGGRKGRKSKPEAREY